MKKDFLKIIILVIITLLIIFTIIYLIDINRMINNKPVLFSTWGYDYAPPEGLYSEEYSFYGKVLESGLNYIIVEPNKGEIERKSSDKISISLQNDKDALVVGTNVKVVYDGYIMESYPAQIHASRIELISKIELMYETIIDDIMKQDGALNNEAKYISLDVDSFVLPIESGKGNIHGKYFPLEDSKKETLLRYCKKYNQEVKDYSIEELKENGLFDEKELKIDGILIYIESVEKITENSAIMTVAKYRSGLGAIFAEYKLTYNKGNWNIKLLSMAIS